MATPNNWADDGTTIMAPNGTTVVGAIAKYIRAHDFDAANVPLAEETADGMQLFTFFELVVASDGTVGFGDVGTQLLTAQTHVSDLTNQVAGLTTQVTELQAQLAAVPPPALAPDPAPALVPDPQPTPAPNPTPAPDFAALIAQLQMDLDALTKRVGAIEATLAGMPSDVTPRVATLEGQITTLQSQLAAVPSAVIARLTADLTTAEAH